MADGVTVAGMAEEGDPERAWAEATARAINDAGSSRRALGRALGISGQSVTEWLNRPAPPPPAQVFRIEQELGKDPGFLSQILGYLPLDFRPITNIAEAIDNDTTLDAAGRAAVLATYETMRALAARQVHERTDSREGGA